MNYFQFKIDPREAAYGRLVAGVLGVLRKAVAMRVDEDVTKAEIAEAANLSAGHLSRILNGNVRNLTLRTVSDLLWATRHDPKDFEADAFECLSPNGSDESYAAAVATTPKATFSGIVISGGSTYIDLTPVRPLVTSAGNS
jgi:hypothetical protein